MYVLVFCLTMSLSLGPFTTCHPVRFLQSSTKMASLASIQPLSLGAQVSDVPSIMNVQKLFNLIAVESW